MPRANRRFDYHTLWHVTHRCHDRAFLLKFARDRDAWRYWLFRARERYGLSVLNYIVTSNHIHLMLETGDRKTAPNALRLIAGCTAQQYNLRKARRGAFWEDRYHAVPIVDAQHFRECLVYVDLNMVRAGVVDDPLAWRWSGLYEIAHVRHRYVALNVDRLLRLTEHQDIERHLAARLTWIDERRASAPLVRESGWTEASASAPP